MSFKNKRTFSFVFWIMLSITMIVVMPNLNKLVVEKGQITIPETSESQIGATYLNELTTNGVATYPFAVVFNSEEQLTNAQLEEIERIIQSIESDRAIPILDSLTHLQSEQAANQLMATDGTTVIAQFAIDQKAGLADEIAVDLRAHLSEATMDTYVTGSDLVISDFASSTQEGIKKTEIIAIVFILLILIAIFKSPIVPMISLISVGVSYVISLSIVALLVEHFDFPFSNFTQVFLVVILFGVGTDYNILLFTRFKEELAKSGHVTKAIATTYATAGKTVVYSGLAVFVGFVALFLAEFSMYKATGAIAIGVAVLLAVLLTLNPFFMSVLGLKIFWPVKEVKGHTENKLWGALSRFAFMRPFVSLLLIAVLTVPFIVQYSNTLNYNDLIEIDDKYESKQAIAVIEEHYDAGFSSPVSLVVKGEQLTTADNLAQLDGLAEVISQVDGVAKVFSVTRPEGDLIQELYVNDQAGTLNEGITEANEGIGQINEGLSDAEQQISQPQDFSSVDELIAGTGRLSNGATDLQKAITSLQSGLQDATAGSNDIAAGAKQLSTKVEELQNGLQSMLASYEQLTAGYEQFNLLFDTAIAGLEGAKQGYEQIEGLMTVAVQQNPSKEVQAALQISQQAQQNLSVAVDQLAKAKTEYEALNKHFTTANTALKKAVDGAATLQVGANELATGSSELSQGLATATSGTNAMKDGSQQLATGLNAVNDGQLQLKEGLTDLQQQMKLLAEGLQVSTEGLDEIYTGLEDANSYLSDLNQQQQRSFFIPQEVLTSDEFKNSITMYMNEQHTLTSMNIILEVNPYTEEAMKIVEQVREVKDSYLMASSLQNAEGYLGGKTMVNVDLQTISQADFIRSAIVMLIGIVLILLFVTRSAFQSGIILIALIVTNFAALGITELIVQQLLGHELVSWNVPFFTLIMIVTLGVDYSIFFLMRYNESKELGVGQILPAAREMGGVVVSAAIILGGTFAALIPSGIITLIQVAIAVMVGLILLSVFIMPIFIPAFFGLIDKFKKRNKND